MNEVVAKNWAAAEVDGIPKPATETQSHNRRNTLPAAGLKEPRPPVLKLHLMPHVQVLPTSPVRQSDMRKSHGWDDGEQVLTPKRASSKAR